MARTYIKAAFCQYPVHPDDLELLGMPNGRENTISIRSSTLGYVVPRSSLLGLVPGVSDALEWIAIYDLLISFVDHILHDVIM